MTLECLNGAAERYCGFFRLTEKACAQRDGKSRGHPKKLPDLCGPGCAERKGSMLDQGLIDLHTHILPQMDDGSPEEGISVEMLRREKAQGVGLVCGTSHYYADRWSVEEFCRRREESLDRLAKRLPAGLPRIVPAAEAAFFSGISECAGLERLCIQGTRTLMLEMPFTEWHGFQVEEVSSLVLDRGFQVVLVHPERFCTSKGNRQKLRELEELPVYLQVNAKTLLRWRTRRLGLELLREARYPLLASDCHNLTTRPPNLAQGRDIVARKLGEGYLDAIDRNAAQLAGRAAEEAAP